MFKENNKTDFIFSKSSVAKAKGFTLMEVLVVFVIMALVLAIVPPFLPNVIPSINVNSTTR